MLGVDSHVYELMERLNWTSLLQEFSRVPKGSHLGDVKGAHWHWLKVLLGSMMSHVCTVKREHYYTTILLFGESGYVCDCKIATFPSSFQECNNA